MIPRALDVSVPSQLTLALVPELVLMGGAMLLLVWAAWRRDSDDHQRTVGMASIMVTGATLFLNLRWAALYVAVPGPPPVSMKITSNSLTASSRRKVTASRMIGES